MCPYGLFAYWRFCIVCRKLYTRTVFRQYESDYGSLIHLVAQTIFRKTDTWMFCLLWRAHEVSKLCSRRISCLLGEIYKISLLEFKKSKTINFWKLEIRNSSFLFFSFFRCIADNHVFGYCWCQPQYWAIKERQKKNSDKMLLKIIFPFIFSNITFPVKINSIFSSRN